MENFPYKTLIWALVTVSALVIFRNDLSGMISNTEEFTIFEKITLKVSKSESKALKIAQVEYEKKIDSLNYRINIQNRDIVALDSLSDKLSSQIKDCNNSKALTDSMRTKFNRINMASKYLKVQSDVLKNTKMIRKKKS